LLLLCSILFYYQLKLFYAAAVHFIPSFLFISVEWLIRDVWNFVLFDFSDSSLPYSIRSSLLYSIQPSSVRSSIRSSVLYSIRPSSVFYSTFSVIQGLNFQILFRWIQTNITNLSYLQFDFTIRARGHCIGKSKPLNIILLWINALCSFSPPPPPPAVSFSSCSSVFGF
jgi:hypothetical protein